MLNASLARNEFRFKNQAAAPATRITGSVLPAPVADPVFHGAHLRGVCAAGKIEAMAGSEPTGRRAGCLGREGSQDGGRDLCGGNLPSRGQCAAGSNERRDKEKTAYAGNDGWMFHE